MRVAAAPGGVGLVAAQAGEPRPSVAELMATETGFVLLGLGILLLTVAGIAFAAIAAFLRYRNRRKEQDWSVREEKWESLLLVVLSGDAAAGELRGRVEDGEELFFVDYLMRFARRMRGQSRDTLTHLARPYLDEVVERMTGKDPERRARAVETVALLDFEPHADRILAALGDESAMVTMVAARSVARHQDPEHAPLLLDHLARLREWSPRQLSTLLATMGAGAAPRLREAVSDEARPPEIRAIAADALRRLRDPKAADLAAEVLATAGHRELITATLRLLSVLGRPEHADVIRPFCSQGDPLIRGAALGALAATGATGDQPLFLAALDDDSGWVAIHAARGLATLGDSDSLRSLIDADHPRAALARQVLVERL